MVRATRSIVERVRAVGSEQIRTSPGKDEDPRPQPVSKGALARSRSPDMASIVVVADDPPALVAGMNKIAPRPRATSSLIFDVTFRPGRRSTTKPTTQIMAMTNARQYPGTRWCGWPSRTSLLDLVTVFADRGYA